MPKECRKCNRILGESDFNWKIKNIRRATYCKVCSRNYIKEHYVRNKDYYIAKAKVRTIKHRTFLYKFLGSYLRSHSCVDCGETDIMVLEFDHRDRGKKSYEINKAISKGLSIDNLKKEVRKCDIRCANCHRRKTGIENNNWRHQICIRSSIG